MHETGDADQRQHSRDHVTRLVPVFWQHHQDEDTQLPSLPDANTLEVYVREDMHH